LLGTTAKQLCPFQKSFLYNKISTWPHLRSKHMGKKQSLMGDVYLSMK
jgi:hypothetical protein